jgi:hypothetical protein
MQFDHALSVSVTRWGLQHINYPLIFLRVFACKLCANWQGWQLMAGLAVQQPAG